MKQAEEGVEALQKVVDTLIIIPNQNLFRLANEKTTFTEAFALADDVLYQGVKGVTDLMVCPGLINLDFADVRAVMDEMGKAMMGTGEATGEDRAIQAAEKAIANPLLDEISLRGAKGVLINITGGHDLTLFELDEAANRIREEVDPEANIIVGSTLDDAMVGAIRVSVVATGIDVMAATAEVPVPRRRMAAPLAMPEAQEAPVAAEAAPMAARGYDPEEPTLFQDIESDSAEADVVWEEETAEMDDGLPAPVYQTSAPRPQARPAADAQDPAAQFVAPKARAAGTPSPEAMARLQAAVKKVPLQEPRGAAPAVPAGDRAPRFGINSLINRMTGHAAEMQRPAPQPVTRRQPPVQTAPAMDDEMSPDQERIEIPAFLRRQAN
jgi:cell division protein FtsZ